MKPIQIEGIATIGKRSFRFDSGLPSSEPVLDAAQKLHGTIHIQPNACVEFHDNGRIYLPPVIHDIARGEGYTVRRTTRHYVIQLKVPVVESRQESEDKLSAALPSILGDITLDRAEVLGGALGYPE